MMNAKMRMNDAVVKFRNALANFDFVDIAGLLFAVAVAAFAAVSALADTAAPAKRTVLMVDENGELNSTNAVSTVADLAAAATSALVADAKASAADTAAKRGTNMVNAVAAAIASNELVVYVKGRVSSFEAGVLFGPDDKIDIYDFDVYYNSDGTMTAKTWWYSTVAIGSSDVFLKWADSLGTNTVFTAVEADSNVPLGKQTFGANTYENAYLMTKTFDAMPASFFRVGLEPDAPSGDGSSMEIAGVTGGYTGTFVAGETLVVSNGVVVGRAAQ